VYSVDALVVSVPVAGDSASRVSPRRSYRAGQTLREDLGDVGPATRLASVVLDTHAALAIDTHTDTHTLIETERQTDRQTQRDKQTERGS